MDIYSEVLSYTEMSSNFINTLYIVKLGFTGVYIFSYFVLKRRLRVLVEAVLTCTHNLGFEQK